AAADAFHQHAAVAGLLQSTRLVAVEHGVVVDQLEAVGAAFERELLHVGAAVAEIARHWRDEAHALAITLEAHDLAVFGLFDDQRPALHQLTPDKLLDHAQAIGLFDDLLAGTGRAHAGAKAAVGHRHDDRHQRNGQQNLDQSKSTLSALPTGCPGPRSGTFLMPPPASAKAVTLPQVTGRPGPRSGTSPASPQALAEPRAQTHRRGPPPICSWRSSQ